MAKALITGGAGFIGSHVAETFQRAGHAVTVIDDLSSGFEHNVPPGADFHRMDIGSPEAASLVRSGEFSVIAHLAAHVDLRRSVSDPAFDARTNIIGTLNLLQAVREVPAGKRPRMIFASTGGALYGTDAPLPATEETPTNPDAPYGVAKLAAELYFTYYARLWGMDTVVLRFGNVYGPRQNPHGDAGVIAIFARRLANDEPIIVYGAGTQTRDFVYVGDVANAFLIGSTSPLQPPASITSRAFNIGTGIETSILELARQLGEAAGVVPRIEHRPARAGEVERSLLSIDKAARVLGWAPQVTLREGLAHTIEWAVSPI